MLSGESSALEEILTVYVVGEAGRREQGAAALHSLLLAPAAHQSSCVERDQERKCKESVANVSKTQFWKCSA